MDRDELLVVWNRQIPPPDDDPLLYNDDVNILCQSTGRIIIGEIIWLPLHEKYSFRFAEQIAGPQPNIMYSELVLDHDEFLEIEEIINNFYGIHVIRKMTEEDFAPFKIGNNVVSIGNSE
ncbi:MAG: hypothetical protein LR008_02505 [Candidatus Pacebacteria bacterium]|nr:hypothetical protein [Candidatus Paceibacterota bacterium]